MDIPATGSTRAGSEAVVLLGAKIKIFATRAGSPQPVDRHIGASFHGTVLPVAAVGVGQIEEVITGSSREARVYLPGCCGFLTSWTTAPRSLQHPR